MRKLKLCGYDLNGISDQVAKNWAFTVGGEEVIGGEHLSLPVRAPCIVNVSGSNKDNWIGGAQASLAPHGRGGGWGEVGDSQRRRAVSDLIVDDTAPREQLAAALAGLASGAKYTVVSLNEDHPDTETLQERLISSIAKTKLGRPLLVWRSVLVVLGELSSANSNFSLHDKMEIGVVCHSPKGMSIQKLVLRSTGRDTGPAFAPERQRPARLIEPQLGYDHLLRKSKAAIISCFDERSAQSIDVSTNQVELALNGKCDEALVRNLRGDFIHIAPIELPHQGFSFVDDGLDELQSCDLVILESLCSERVKAQLCEALHKVISKPVHASKSDIVARGALEAAKRFSSGSPVYFDFLPTISTIVLKEAEASSIDLVTADETLPAGKVYRSPKPVQFAIQPGQEDISIYLNKQLSERPRKTVVSLGSPAKEIVPVAVSVEQAPAAGRAKIIVDAPMISRNFLVDWDKATELDMTWEDLIDDLSHNPPSIPKRLVLPCSIDHWQGINEEGGLAKLVEEQVKAQEPNWSLLSRALSARFQGAYPISSDGKLPDGLDQKTLTAFDQLTDVAMNQIETRIAAARSEDNDPIKFLTWQFKRAPSRITELLTSVLRERDARGNHPTVAHVSSWVLFYQGVGRTCSLENDEHKAIRTIIDDKRVKWSWRMQTAAMAFILSRSDSAPLLLTREDVEYLAQRVISEFNDELGSSYTRFNYAPFLLAGLVRWRLKTPDALVLGTDPLAEDLKITVEQTMEDLKRLSRHGWSQQQKAERYREVLENLMDELRGTSTNPDLLLDIYNL